MIVLLAAALSGGLVGFAVAWPYGALAGFFGAQLGATFLTLAAGLLLSSYRARAERKQDEAFRLISRA